MPAGDLVAQEAGLAGPRRDQEQRPVERGVQGGQHVGLRRVGDGQGGGMPGVSEQAAPNGLEVRQFLQLRDEPVKVHALN